MHDWWASLLAAATGEVIHMGCATISYRQHGDNSVGAEKFTIGRALSALDTKRETERASIAQAGELVRVFSDCLSADQRSQADAYLAIKNSSPVSRIALMNKAGIWRHGVLRNAATFLIFMTLGRC